jgi:CHAT domain-containing protein
MFMPIQRLVGIWASGSWGRWLVRGAAIAWQWGRPPHRFVLWALLGALAATMGQAALPVGNADGLRPVVACCPQGLDHRAISDPLNQAQALQAQGFYRRAQAQLEALRPMLQALPDSPLKAHGYLSLGHGARLVGELEVAETALLESLAIAQRLDLQGAEGLPTGQSPALRALPIGADRAPSQQLPALFQLGNLRLAQQNSTAALALFEQAAAVASPVQLAAQLHRWKLLIQLDRRLQAAQLMPDLENQLGQLPPSSLAIYGRLELADGLMLWEQGDRESLSEPARQSIAPLLAAAVQLAQRQGDGRGESWALGRLGRWHELHQRPQEALAYTIRALQVAQKSAAADVIYQWQWQLGRLFKAQGRLPEAITVYTQAVARLQALRGDLVAIAADVQFSFREQVEPVYRELVDLLLQPGASPTQLAQAREVIESLQLATLQNFFRSNCLDATAKAADTVDPDAAVVYPIVLSDRLAVILSLPGQPLQQYSTPLTAPQIAAGIERMRQSMRPTAFANERLAAAQELYRWLILPAQTALAAHPVKTLVFVLDAALQNLPMAALHDGRDYLIQRYQVALTPSLQILGPRALSAPQLTALVGGLSRSPTGAPNLLGVQRELDQIRQILPSTVLADRAFTTAAVGAQLAAHPFSVLHLATHGQFGSQEKDTFLLTWDGRLTGQDLRNFLTARRGAGFTPIELLVLSACETAEGDKQAALGLAGIAVRSGARSTLATLWTVNDQSTATFMNYFYRALAVPGTARSAAVRQAQLQLLADPTLNHPYYWAAFILVGNWL